MKNKSGIIILSVLAILCVLAAFLPKKERTEPNTKVEIDSYLRPDHVCVAYSTDANYVYPTIVSMTSVMETANEDTIYDFTILISDTVTDDMQEKFYTIGDKYENCSINIVDMSKEFADADAAMWSTAMYYRLNLPEILPDEEKCLYLDGDTMARKDIAEMFTIDMDDYYIAGVRDFNVYINSTSSHHHYIGVDNLESYVCSGVLLMNLEKMRQDGVQEKLKQVIEKNNETKAFVYPDQDALNFVCFGHILSLPLKYGALVHTDFNKSYEESEYAQWASNKKDWDEGRTDPVVVHFTGTKPWSEIYSNLCQEWWDYTNKSDFKDEIAEKYKPAKKI